MQSGTRQTPVKPSQAAAGIRLGVGTRNTTNMKQGTYIYIRAVWLL